MKFRTAFKKYQFVAGVYLFLDESNLMSETNFLSASVS